MRHLEGGKLPASMARLHSRKWSLPASPLMPGMPSDPGRPLSPFSPGNPGLPNGKQKTPECHQFESSRHLHTQAREGARLTYLDSRHSLASPWGLGSQGPLGYQRCLFLLSLQDSPESLRPLDLPVSRQWAHAFYICPRTKVWGPFLDNSMHFGAINVALENPISSFLTKSQSPHPKNGKPRTKEPIICFYPSWSSHPSFPARESLLPCLSNSL